MRRTPLLRTSFVAALALVLFGPASAQLTETEVIQGVDLAKAPLGLKPGWAGGVLRVKITGLTNTDADHLKFRYSATGDLDMDAAHLAVRTVFESGATRTVDLPIIPGESLSLVDPPPGVKVAVISAIAPNLLKPEQRLPGSTVVSLGSSSTDLEKRYAAAFGHLRASSVGGYLECTAFRVAKGYWLTAAHCGHRSPERPDDAVFVKWQLQPQNWPGSAKTAAPWDAKPVASGLRDKTATAATMMTVGDLDWMLVQVDGDTGGPSLPLRLDAPAQAGTELELLQHSTGDIPPPEGKAVAAGCTIFPDKAGEGATKPALCPQGLRHGCSSQPGASGGPLVAAKKDFALVGVHYRAGGPSWNCAVPAASVALEICQNSALSRKVLTCPAS